MDIPSPPPTATAAATTTAAATATVSPVKDPDHDNPDDPIPFPKQLPPPFTNGVLKRHKPLHHHHNPPPVVVSYKECLKNHAASLGGHAVDGCGEFMPSPASTPTDPTSIKCAACGCHRNFHRRDPGGLGGLFVNTNIPPPGSHAGSGSSHVVEYQPHHRHHPPPPPHPISVAADPSVAPATEEPSGSGEDSPSPPPISSSYYPSAPHMLLTLSSGLSIPPREIGEIGIGPSMSMPISTGIGSNSSGKKRFRTKFTQDQKEKMHELAERVGWKMQKKDEDLIIRICNEIGVDKGVFKVWMHNNKMTFGKKDSGNQHMIDSGSSGGGVDGLNFLIHRNNHHDHHHQHDHDHQHEPNNDSGSSGGGNAIGTNGSSSSS